MAEVSLATLVAGLRSGEWLASFPTDTVPALAARCDRGELIFTAKQRQPDKPLILMAATAEQLWPYVQGTARDWSHWKNICDRHWPGPLTVVLPAGKLPSGLNPQDTGTVGLRVPDWPLARCILQQTGPLATTSVNRSGQPPLLDVGAIAQVFPQVLTLGASAWRSPEGPTQPSTVIAWQRGRWQVLRQGAIALGDIELEAF
ncbi:L-threonylcarbamoyladenylate synthase [Candidatus Synechococcus calcipolaris G9]|uniref:L-threonylcarbamoyladenylate synthase n=1 Tax=Candidatus Synechococcus calcipolaris G9 TaxID=1497997 RepID=A0ABT6EUI7_9SYNE|nr:L-threonylcarbamoyladenylate synthase [Candidatus Synechococcus calcipolaris]MDG2989532.1 L-threonylcarbamoyladenylate synthase [Candidatus Synechococcus calcipolaris G9]